MDKKLLRLTQVAQILDMRGAGVQVGTRRRVVGSPHRPTIGR